MKPGIFSVYLLSTITLCNLNIASSVAQISSDGTLSTTITSDDAINFLIENGDRAGDNLFHSFSEFSVPNLGEAYFNNATDIVNIFSRVTGGNISDIQGLIRANGTANLFLINPAGIMFGDNASLDIGGSFFATTAESIVFGESLEFSATQPEAAPLLTININPGLQMGSNSGSITVQGSGHAITGGVFLPLSFNDTATGLQVNPGETLGLISNEINLTGGIIRVPGGNIQLSSIEEGILQLDNSSQTWQFDTSQVDIFANINLSNQALVDTSGFFTGNIQLQGRNVTFEDASTIAIQNLGNQPSGDIRINATNSLHMSGSVRNAPDIMVTPTSFRSGVAVSRLFTETLGSGKAGNIIISSNNLFLTGGGSILSHSYSDADTGSVDVNVSELMELTNFSPLNPNISSSISTATYNSGDAGEINVSAKNLFMLDGSNIFASNSGIGEGGEVEFNITEDFVISGFEPTLAFSTSVGSVTLGIGNSNSLNINVARLSVSNGGAVSTATGALGDGGTMTINASEYISVSGTVPELNLISGINSDAPILDPNLREAIGVPDQPSGNSGTVILNTPSLIITDGGKVSVGNEGLGNSGDLEINTNQIFLDTGGSITAFSASGQGGNIELNITDSLLLRNGSAITAEATGTLANNQSVDGGNIEINSDLVTLLEASQINANAFEGNGGNITINTQGLFVSPDSNITASSQFGVDGVVTINNPEAGKTNTLLELPSDTTDASQQIAEGCEWTATSSFYITGRGGIPEDPTAIIRADEIISDVRSSPNIQSSENQSLVITHQPAVIEANAWIINEQGNVELVAVVNAPKASLILSEC